MTGSESEDDLWILIDGLIQEAYELLSETINATRAADERAKQRGVDWIHRHRLQVLLEAAEDTRKSLPNGVVAPWFLAELRATLDVVRRWREKPSWKEIEPSLKDPDHFTHTILKLHVAEHLERGGHKIAIVPRGASSSPDLMLHAIGGSQDLVRVECYQPSALCGRPTDLSAEEAENIVKKSMEKAKRQIGIKIPGILAICGYNQSSESVETPGQAVQSRLSKTSRPNLCGIELIMLGVLFSVDKDKRSFSSIVSANFMPNPSYFGRVGIEDKVPNSHPNLIESPLIDISTDKLLSGDINLVSASKVGSAPVKKKRPTVTRVRKLSIIEEPERLSRSVVHGTGTKVPPLFVGEGNLDCLCCHCGAMLAKCAWDASISNIVVECPSCRSHNEFPALPDSGYDRVVVTRGNYYFSDAVKLKRGVQLEGQ